MATNDFQGHSMMFTLKLILTDLLEKKRNTQTQPPFLQMGEQTNLEGCKKTRWWFHFTMIPGQIDPI